MERLEPYHDLEMILNSFLIFVCSSFSKTNDILELALIAKLITKMDNNNNNF